MLPLTPDDHALIAHARDAIRRNYDGVRGACAEQVALGTAITEGQRDFTTIVAVRGENGEEIIPPCGNCRQILSDYAPDCAVILDTGGALAKISARNCCPLLIIQKTPKQTATVRSGLSRLYFRGQS